MRVLALDLSTSTGYAILEDGHIITYGTLANDKTAAEYAEYPWGPVLAARDQGEAIRRRLLLGAYVTPEQARGEKPIYDCAVIEETNLGRNRYSQKQLEFVHYCVLAVLEEFKIPVKYVSTGVWRKALGIYLSKEDKAQNTRLAKAKREARLDGKKLDKKALGIRGKINKKHVALRYVIEHFGFPLKVKDNDVADAICLGLAFFAGVQFCNGK